MSEIISFNFKDNEVRVLEINGEPWVVAKDIATALGYRDASNMLRVLDEDEKGTHEVCTLGGNQTDQAVYKSSSVHQRRKRCVAKPKHRK